MLGSPEAAYRAFWVLWSIYAGLAFAAVVAVAVLVMIRAHREDTGRIVRAIQLQGKGE